MCRMCHTAESVRGGRPRGRPARTQCARRTAAVAVQRVHLVVVRLCSMRTAAVAVRGLHRDCSQRCRVCTAQGAVRAAHSVSIAGASWCTSRSAVQGLHLRDDCTCMKKFSSCLCGGVHTGRSSSAIERAVDRPAGQASQWPQVILRDADFEWLAGSGARLRRFRRGLVLWLLGWVAVDARHCAK